MLRGADVCASSSPRNLCAFCARVFERSGAARSVVAVFGGGDCTAIGATAADAIAAHPSTISISRRPQTASGVMKSDCIGALYRRCLPPDDERNFAWCELSAR